MVIEMKEQKYRKSLSLPTIFFFKAQKYSYRAVPHSEI